MEPKPYQEEASLLVWEKWARWYTTHGAEIFGESALTNDFPEIMGKKKPFFCYLKSITGSGKTFIISLILKRLKNNIVFVTVPWKEVKEQLQTKLGEFLPECEVLSLEAAKTKWLSICEKKLGVTIIVSTTASWNATSVEKEGKKVLRRELDDNESLWHMLRDSARRIVVVYDEGHHLAKGSQWWGLLALNPIVILSTSASFPKETITYLGSGDDPAAKTKSIENEHVVVVDPCKVAETGLIKTEIVIESAPLTPAAIIKAAVGKVHALQQLAMQHHLTPPPACAIMVKGSQKKAGLTQTIEVCTALLDAGVSKDSIAVHIEGAEGNPYFKDFHCTLDQGQSPKGFLFLIWDASLNEGFDYPPLAVGCFYTNTKAEVLIEQRIGRFMRQPYQREGGLPPELCTIYLYLNDPPVVQKETSGKEIND